jgi:creatinine amidohydrolase/Fe(II)-dependent formamide hydrolase-like protein
MHFGHKVDLAKANAQDFLNDTSEFCSNDMLAGSGKVFWSTWARQRSKAGIYGDPTVASAETGRQTFEAIIDKMTRFCTEFYDSKPET